MNISSDHTYQVDPQLLIIIIKQVNRLKRDCYICDLVLLFYTAYAYSKVTNDDWSQFILWEVCIVLVLGLVQYLLIAGRGRFISRIVVDINMADEYISLKTSGFNGPFWFKKPSAELRFKKAGTKARRIKNRYVGIFTNSEHILLLNHEGREVYLLPGYFNWRLEEELLKSNS
ncbi:hypothetical protein [Mucilaginibacter boryungensis]|uniref:PH (Pleckstrin Homology) domain-containing protein n=1 Tax=Mucilaginibacter boryungensis TaxID=768480 RepID=A0ABR9XL50_9SPHI|nr:hypothetical protein [Mucilaginibacter boryungensis]MBE9667970.1 hypothetical protein [Mucilaginibacter boryungensis]